MPQMPSKEKPVDGEQERCVQTCRHYWYEFLLAAEKAGMKIKDASFEERCGNRMRIELLAHMEEVAK